jgi:hypothetical protein
LSLQGHQLDPLKWNESMKKPPSESNAVISDEALDEVSKKSSEPIGVDNSDAHSDLFVGRWQQLTSDTNWEKGRIIAQWRAALIADGTPSSQYSDESWATRVGYVTCQHVGRLRRVYDRFGETYVEYPKLFWTHFWAAIDWDDAELWLEGASKSRWSISKMCRMRAESMQLADGQTADTVVANETNRIESETDDGFESSNAPTQVIEDSQDQSQEPFESSPLNEGPDFGDDDHGQSLEPVSQSDVVTEMSGETIPAKSPFEGLGKLPLDIVEAVDPLKLCILRYRANDWNGFSKSQMLDLIEALKGFCQ